MFNIILIDNETAEVLKVVETTRPEWTADQMMRNRDPVRFSVRVMHEANEPDSSD